MTQVMQRLAQSAFLATPRRGWFQKAQQLQPAGEALWLRRVLWQDFTLHTLIGQANLHNEPQPTSRSWMHRPRYSVIQAACLRDGPRDCPSLE